MEILFLAFGSLIFGWLFLLLCVEIDELVRDFIEAKDFTKGPLGVFVRGIVYGFKHPGYRRIRSKYAYSDGLTVDVLEEEYADYVKKKKEYRIKNEAYQAEYERKNREYKRKNEAYRKRNEALRERNIKQVKYWNYYLEFELYRKPPPSMSDPQIVGTMPIA